MDGFRTWIREKVTKFFPSFETELQNNENELRSRKVFLLHQLPPGEEQPSQKVDNKISSSKYTVLTFLPLNMYEQVNSIVR